MGIAATGLLTLGYFAIASHVLGEQSAKRIDLLWSVMFVVISVIVAAGSELAAPAGKSQQVTAGPPAAAKT